MLIAYYFQVRYDPEQTTSKSIIIHAITEIKFFNRSNGICPDKTLGTLKKRKSVSEYQNSGVILE